MAWTVTSPPSAMRAVAGKGNQIIMAIRVESDSGETELLVTNSGESPAWIPIAAVTSAFNMK